MDSDQATVARFESGQRDLHQSTLRRYALAVNALIEHVVRDGASANRKTGEYVASLVAHQTWPTTLPDWESEHLETESLSQALASKAVRASRAGAASTSRASHA